MTDTDAARARQSSALSATARPSATPTSVADWTYQRLVRYIKQFEAELDDNHEIGGRMVSFGSMVQFHIVDLGYWDPDLITFDGVDDNGNKMRLIQNVSQLNVLLVAVLKRKPEAEPTRIGFELESRIAGAKRAGEGS